MKRVPDEAGMVFPSDLCDAPRGATVLRISFLLPSEGTLNMHSVGLSLLTRGRKEIRRGGTSK